MIKIIPAILPKSYSELEGSLAKLKGIVSTIQIDVVDGEFAPNTTWPYDEVGKIEFEKIVSSERAMPFADEFNFEFDLMVKDALQAAERYAKIGASRIVFHLESGNTKEALLSLQGARGEGSGLLFLGIALPSKASVDALAPFEGFYDFVQVMGIEKVGFQGQPFDEKSLTLIRELRQQYPDIVISVDGGVRMENIPALVEAGANKLVAGSLILSASDIEQKIHEIIELANHGTDRSKN